jgi:hypothetical protein
MDIIFQRKQKKGWKERVDKEQKTNEKKRKIDERRKENVFP